MNHGSSGGRRTLAFSPSVATPKPGSVPVPSLADARAAFGSGVGSLRSHELAEVLTSLHLDVSGGSALARVTERRAEALRVLEVYPNYARAALWLFRLAAQGDVAGANAVRSILPPADQPTPEVSHLFGRPDGLDLDEIGGGLGAAPASGSGAAASTPFGRLIPLPPGPPTGGAGAAGGGAATNDIIR